MKRLIAIATLAGAAALGTSGTAAADPTCASTLGIAVHGQHIVADYVTGLHGDLSWPPAGQVGGGGGAALPGGPGPGFHFPLGFAPGASFCNEQSKSPGLHLGP